MSSTTNANFDKNTEALEVAKTFAGNIRGKTILVTGVNLKGVGFSTAEAFASQSPSHLILAGRTPSKLQESIDALKAQYPDVDYRALTLDLSRQKAVRIAASELISWNDVPAIDILVNNAAIMNHPERVITPDGVELTFATNHVGHYLFANLILPKLLKASSSNAKGATRIVNVTALSPTRCTMRWSDLNFETLNKDLPQAEQPHYPILEMFGSKDNENKAYVPIESYNQSKVANLLFSIAANKRLYEKHGILSFAVHPGLIMTELSRDAAPETMEAITKIFVTPGFELKSQGAGASTSLVAALDPKLGPGMAKDGKENWGTYLMDCQISDQATELAESNEQAEKLWEMSEELVKEKFAW